MAGFGDEDDMNAAGHARKGRRADDGLAIKDGQLRSVALGKTMLGGCIPRNANAAVDLDIEYITVLPIKPEQKNEKAKS